MGVVKTLQGKISNFDWTFNDYFQHWLFQNIFVYIYSPFFKFIQKNIHLNYKNKVSMTKL